MDSSIPPPSSSSSSSVLSSSSSVSSTAVSVSSISIRYEISRTAQYIYEGKYRRVALQFPDELLHDSPSVITHLRKELLRVYTTNGSPLPPSSSTSSSSSSSVSTMISSSSTDLTLLTLPVQLFILGDTSYGSCCVDEVAAAHGNAECIIHYGHACLSSPTSLPVLYIFGQQEEITVQQQNTITRTLTDELTKISSSSSSVGYEYIVFLWDPELTYKVPSILDQVVTEELVQHYRQCSSNNNNHNNNTTITMDTKIKNEAELCKPSNESITFTSPISSLLLPTLARSYHPSLLPHHYPSSSASALVTTFAPTNTIITNGETNQSNLPFTDNTVPNIPSSPLLLSCCGFTLSSSSSSILSIMDPSVWISKTCIIYWGNKETRCRLLISQYAQAAKLVYVPLSSSSVANVEDIGHQSSRIMAKRYRMIEAIRAANIIGIVCGTLAVEGHQQLVETLTKIIKGSDKNLYILLLGKLNPAKLANFPEIDIFILVACPESTFLDATAYSKPIGTPHEVIVALADYTNAELVNNITNDSKEWKGYSIVNFNELLPSTSSANGNSTTCQCSNTENSTHDDDDEEEAVPVFSLLSSSSGHGTTAVLRKRNKSCNCSFHNPPVRIPNNNNHRISNIASDAFSTAVVPTNASSSSSSTLSNYSQYGKAAEYYHTKRQWKGLSYDIDPSNLDEELSSMNVSSLPNNSNSNGNNATATTTLASVSEAIVSVPKETIGRPVYKTTIHTGNHGIASSYTYEGK